MNDIGFTRAETIAIHRRDGFRGGGSLTEHIISGINLTFLNSIFQRIPKNAPKYQFICFKVYLTEPICVSGPILCHHIVDLSQKC